MGIYKVCCCYYYIEKFRSIFRLIEDTVRRKPMQWNSIMFGMRSANSIRAHSLFILYIRNLNTDVPFPITLFVR